MHQHSSDYSDNINKLEYNHDECSTQMTCRNPGRTGRNKQITDQGDPKMDIPLLLNHDNQIPDKHKRRMLRIDRIAQRVQASKARQAYRKQHITKMTSSKQNKLQYNPLLSSISTLSALFLTTLWLDSQLLKLINLFPLQLLELEQVLPYKQLRPILKMLNTVISASDKQIKYGYNEFQIGDSQQNQSMWKEHAIYMLQSSYRVWQMRWSIQQYCQLVNETLYANIETFRFGQYIGAQVADCSHISVQATSDLSYMNTAQLARNDNSVPAPSKQNNIDNSVYSAAQTINRIIQEILGSYGIDSKAIMRRALIMRYLTDIQQI